MTTLSLKSKVIRCSFFILKKNRDVSDTISVHINLALPTINPILVTPKFPEQKCNSQSGKTFFIILLKTTS